MNNKSLEQELVLKKWKENNNIGTYIGGTGVGKTRIGVLAIKEILDKNEPNDNTSKAIVIVPTQNLRDNEWNNEIDKWGCNYLRDKIEIVCIQSACRYEKNSYSIVIIDEVHTALGDVYKNFLDNNNYNNILCLTATLDNEDHQNYLFTKCPVIHETSLNRALELGIVSNFKTFNIPVNFTSEEFKEYTKVDATFKKCTYKLGGKKALSNAFKVLANTNEYSKEVVTAAVLFTKSMAKRLELIDNAEKKVSSTTSLLKLFNNHKAIVFSQSIDFANKLVESYGNQSAVFHSKLKAKERKQVLEDFSNNKIQVLSTCKALNAGFNVPDCSLGICASGRSTKLDQIQRTGRVIRHQEGKTAIFVNFYVINTQEENYVRKRTEDLSNVYWIDSIHEIKNYL